MKDTGVSPPRSQVWTKVLRFPGGVERPSIEYPTTRKLKWVFTRPFSIKDEIVKRRDNIIEPDQEVAGANFKEKEIKGMIFVTQTPGHSMMTAVGEHAAKVLAGKLTDHEQFLAADEQTKVRRMHGLSFKNVGGIWIAKVQGLIDYMSWSQLMTDTSTGECQERADEMAGTRKHGLTWPQMPPLGRLDPKDGRCPGFYSSLYLRFERGIFYVNDPLLIDPDAWLLKFTAPEFSDASPEIIAARDRLIMEMADDNKLIEKYHLGLLSTADGHPKPKEIRKLLKHPYMWYRHKRGIDGLNQFLWDKPTRAGCTLIGLITGRKMTNKGGADNQVPDCEIPLRSGLTPEEFLDLYAWELGREIVFLI